MTKYSVLKRVTITTAIGVGALAAVLIATPVHIDDTSAMSWVKSSQIQLERKAEAIEATKEEVNEALSEEREARAIIERILQKEGIPYQTDVADSQLGQLDFLITTRTGRIGIEYGNQQEIKNKEYEGRISRNIYLTGGENKQLDYHYIPGPEWNVEHFIYTKGIVRMIKERM